MSAALHGILTGLLIEVVGIGALWAVYVLAPIVMRSRSRAPSPWFPMLGYQAGAIIGALTVSAWWRIPVYVAGTVVLVAIWWWRRKKRRNVAALLGAKSRALRDALVRKVRELATPRPVLRPVPVPQ